MVFTITHAIITNARLKSESNTIERISAESTNLAEAGDNASRSSVSARMRSSTQKNERSSKRSDSQKLGDCIYRKLWLSHRENESKKVMLEDPIWIIRGVQKRGDQVIPVRVKFLSLRTRRSHIEGWTKRGWNSKYLHTMPACEDPRRILTFTNTLLEFQRRMDMIHTIHEPVVLKRIIEAHQAHVSINCWLRKIFLVDLTAKMMKHLIQTMLIIFSFCHTDIRNISFGAVTSQPSGFLAIKKISMLPISVSSKFH